MKIRVVVDEWVGNKKGDILNLPEEWALSAVDYLRVAEFVEHSKSIKRATKDKMVKGAEVEK
jgi:hypothetical protein